MLPLDRGKPAEQFQNPQTGVEVHEESVSVCNSVFFFSGEDKTELSSLEKQPKK